jgi:hypothetical protein
MLFTPSEGLVMFLDLVWDVERLSLRPGTSVMWFGSEVLSHVRSDARVSGERAACLRYRWCAKK